MAPTCRCRYLLGPGAGRTTMTDTAAHDAENVARSVFAGLVPSEPLRRSDPHREALRARASRAAFSTVPIILLGSLAAMTLNLAGPAQPAEAKPPSKPRGGTAEPGKSVREAMAAMSGAAARTASAARTAPSAAPTTYRVAEGDTISDIAGRYGLSTASVLALNGLSWSSLIFPGQELKLTASGHISPVTPPSQQSGAGRYTIVAGDTISAIADRFGISTLSLLSANGLGWSSIIYPGQTLAIPGLIGPDTDLEAPVEAPAPAREAPHESAPPAQVVPVSPDPSAGEPPTPMAIAGTYTVRSGDTLSAIAAAHGIDTQALLDVNPLAWDSLIFAGDQLAIPGGATAAQLAGDVTAMNDEMRSNAAAIVQVGRELGVPDYGIIIALATAMQESTLRNLSWGDRDSVGLFQQRPSSGWGSVENLTTPSHAARLFYGGPGNPNAGSTRGLLDIAGWQSMSVAQAAQAVQISAFPDAYAKWEASAYAWFVELR